MQIAKATLPASRIIPLFSLGTIPIFAALLAVANAVIGQNYNYEEWISLIKSDPWAIFYANFWLTVISTGIMVFVWGFSIFRFVTAKAICNSCYGFNQNCETCNGSGKVSSKNKWKIFKTVSLVIFAIFILSVGFTPAYAITAPTSINPSLMSSTVNCPGTWTFCVFSTVVSATTYYGAANSSGISYGYQSALFPNQGGATGTNATTVLQNAINKGGNFSTISISQGSTISVNNIITIKQSYLTLTSPITEENSYGTNQAFSSGTSLPFYIANLTLDSTAHQVVDDVFNGVQLGSLTLNAVTNTIGYITISNSQILRESNKNGISVTGGSGTNGFVYFVHFLHDQLADNPTCGNTNAYSCTGHGFFTWNNTNSGNGQIYLENDEYLNNANSTFLQVNGVLGPIFELEGGYVENNPATNNNLNLTVVNDAGSLYSFESNGVGYELHGPSTFVRIQTGASFIGANFHGSMIDVFPANTTVNIIQNYKALANWVGKIESVTFSGNTFLPINVALTGINIGSPGQIGTSSGITFNFLVSGNTGFNFNPLTTTSFASFSIFANSTSSYYYAENMTTGLIQYSGSNASAVITSALGACPSIGCRVQLGPGKYKISGTGLVISQSNLLFEGAGSSTDFTSTAAFAHNIITVSGTGDTVQFIKVDGRNETRSSAYNGIIVSGTRNTIQNTNVTNADHGGISLTASQNIAQFNTLVNNSDDGIIVGGGSRVSNETVLQNTIYKTYNHNCISLVTVSYSLVQGNTCYQSAHDGIALENLGSGSNYGISVLGNLVRSPSNSGIDVYAQSGGVDSADNSSFIGNTVISSSAFGIIAISGGDLAISQNTILNSAQQAIYLDQAGISSYGDLVSGNLVNKTGSTFECIKESSSGSLFDVQIIGNHLDGCGNDAIHLYKFNGLTISGNSIRNWTSTNKGINLQGTGTYFSIIGNKLIATHGSQTDGILFQGTNSNGTISGNAITGNGVAARGIYFSGTSVDVIVTGNVLNQWANGIRTDSATNDYLTITGNDFRQSVTTPIAISSTGNNHSVIESNMGYNPKKNLVTPFGATGNLFLLDSGGTSATPLNGTTITDGQSPKVLYLDITSAFTAGHTLVIQVDGTTIDTIVGTLVTANLQWTIPLSPGETFNVQYQSGDVTFIVSGQ